MEQSVRFSKQQLYKDRVCVILSKGKNTRFTFKHERLAVPKETTFAQFQSKLRLANRDPTNKNALQANEGLFMMIVTCKGEEIFPNQMDLMSTIQEKYAHPEDQMVHIVYNSESAFGGF